MELLAGQTATTTINRSGVEGKEERSKRWYKIIKQQEVEEKATTGIRGCRKKAKQEAKEEEEREVERKGNGAETSGGEKGKKRVWMGRKKEEAKKEVEEARKLEKLEVRSQLVYAAVLACGRVVSKCVESWGGRWRRSSKAEEEGRWKKGGKEEGRDLGEEGQMEKRYIYTHRIRESEEKRENIPGERMKCNGEMGGRKEREDMGRDGESAQEKREYEQIEGGIMGEAELQEKLWSDGCKMKDPFGITTSASGDVYVSDHAAREVVLKRGSGKGEVIQRYGSDEGLTPTYIAERNDGAAIAVTYMINHLVVVWDVVSGLEIGRSGCGQGKYNYPIGVAGMQNGGFAIGDCVNARVVEIDGQGRWVRVLVALDDEVYGPCGMEEEGIAALAIGLAKKGWIEIVAQEDGKKLRRIGPLNVMPRSLAVDEAGRIIVGGTAVRKEGTDKWSKSRYAVVVIEPDDDDCHEVVVAAGKLIRLIIGYANISVAVVANGRIAVVIKRHDADVFVV